MSSASKVTASAAASVAAPIGRASSGSRTSETFGPISGLAPSSAGISDPWRRTYGDEASGGFGSFADQRKQEDNPQSSFTSFVKLQASTFPASEVVQEYQPSKPIFFADLMRGLGVYEVNMKICQGVFQTQGSVVNRYS